MELSKFLRPDQRRAGFELEADEHLIYLKRYGKILARFTRYDSIQDVQHEADQIIEHEKSGVVFAGIEN